MNDGTGVQTVAFGRSRVMIVHDSTCVQSVWLGRSGVLVVHDGPDVQSAWLGRCGGLVVDYGTGVGDKVPISTRLASDRRVVLTMFSSFLYSR